MKFIECYFKVREIEYLRHTLANIDQSDCHLLKKKCEDKLTILEQTETNPENYLITFRPVLNFEQRKQCHIWIKENLEDWVYLDNYIANFNSKDDKRRFEVWYALAIK